MQARALLATTEEGSALHYEALVARLALEWVLASRHATDVLFEPGVRAAVDALVVLEGFQSDALNLALVQHWGAAPLCAAVGCEVSASAATPIADGPARGGDAEDEAHRAAACVLRHIEQGRIPVALAATDRALIRRVLAHWTTRAWLVRDESRWNLLHHPLGLKADGRAGGGCVERMRPTPCSTGSSTRPRCHLPMPTAWSNGCAATWCRSGAPLQRVISAPSPPWPPPWPRWKAGGMPCAPHGPCRSGCWRCARCWSKRGNGRACRPTLQACVCWRRCACKTANRPNWRVGARAPRRRMTLAEFTRWVKDVLEAGRYVAAQSAEAPVVVLPMPQLLGRPFAAAVLPGSDEKRLQPAPEPSGDWSQAQREAWGLPTRQTLEAAQRAAWANALRTPVVDVLWRTSDEGGEPLLASALVLALQLQGDAAQGADARPPRTVQATPTLRPLPVGQALPVQQLSSTAVLDLRHCPYRFFAQRQLGLREADELDAAVDKRDFGNWLHAVLQRFHEDLRDQPTDDAGERSARMDAAAEAVTREQRLQDGDFLPFAAGWAQLRDGYLHWLAGHEQQGAMFRQAEVKARQPLGDLELIGTIDRIDGVSSTGEPTVLVIDYKTESDSVTRQRIQSGAEDTQLPFYAALLHHDTLRAAYVNVGERGETQLHEQDEVVHLRDVLIEGIQHDMARIAAGAPLPALGEGSVCEFCAVRGLCRKDYWADAEQALPAPETP